MEFTPSLSAFQGVIISADSVHSFSKLSSRGGNEDKVKYVIDSIRNFLQKEKYIVDDKILEDSMQIMRKFAFYIVINSDLTILEEMVDLDGIDFVIWTIPTIPKYLMSEILWRLNMDKFIYETLVFSCPQLGLELGEALVENFKYFNPTECLPKLKLLISANYRVIYKYLFFYFDHDDEITRAFNNFQNCLKFLFDLPNKVKLESLSKDEQYKFMGKRLYLLLSLLIDCFNNYTSVQKLKPSDFQHLYELTYKDGAIIENQTSLVVSACNNKPLLECIDNCNILLLDSCKHLVMDVSVEIFCAWSEYEENGKSMQQTIGELCYKVHSTLCKISSVAGHPVVNMLQQISCKPLDLLEVINKTNAEVIIENINKMDTESAQWVKALIHKDNLCEDQSLMEVLAMHLESLNEDDCCKLFKITLNHLKNTAGNIERELNLVMTIFQRCSSRSKFEIVEEQFSNNCFKDDLQCTDFNNMMTEIFNKLIITPDTDVSDVLTVFLQNPRKVYKKIFALSCDNTQQTDIMVKVMKSLEKFSKHYYDDETEPCIILIAKYIIANLLDTDEKQNNFTRFLSCLKTSNSIPGPKLLLLIIMPNLHSALLSKHIQSIYINCKLLREVYGLVELVEYRAPTLAMLAQVLDTVRWKINTFEYESPSTLEIVLELQTSLLITYESNIPEKESTWLKSKLRNINPLNMYYYRRLWNPPGNTFVEVISGIHIHKDMDMEHLTIWLSQATYCRRPARQIPPQISYHKAIVHFVLLCFGLKDIVATEITGQKIFKNMTSTNVICSTILQEWYQIWDSLTVFGSGKILDLFHDALILLSVAEKSNCTDKSNKCLMYCMKNFVATTRYKFFKPPISDNQISTVFNKIAIIENLVAESDAEDLSLIFLPLFSFIASTKFDISTEVTQILHKKLKKEPFIFIINNLFPSHSGIKTD